MPEDVATHLLLLRHWGKGVKDGRDRDELSQVELAERSGLDQGVISKIERGKYRLTAEHMIAIATALGRELDDLFTFPPGLVSREQYRRQIAELERARASATEAVAS